MIPVSYYFGLFNLLTLFSLIGKPELSKVLNFVLINSFLSKLFSNTQSSSKLKFLLTKHKYIDNLLLYSCILCILQFYRCFLVWSPFFSANFSKNNHILLNIYLLTKEYITSKGTRNAITKLSLAVL